MYANDIEEKTMNNDNIKIKFPRDKFNRYPSSTIFLPRNAQSFSWHDKTKEKCTFVSSQLESKHLITQVRSK